MCFPIEKLYFSKVQYYLDSKLIMILIISGYIISIAFYGGCNLTWFFYLYQKIFHDFLKYGIL